MTRGVQAPDRHHVIGTDDRIGQFSQPVFQIQQTIYAAFVTVIARHNRHRIDVQFFQSFKRALGALHADRGIFGAADQTERLVSCCHQAIDERSFALGLVAANRIDAAILQRAVIKHQRDTPFLHQIDLRSRQSCRFDDTIDLILQNLIEHYIDIAFAFESKQKDSNSAFGEPLA